MAATFNAGNDPLSPTKVNEWSDTLKSMVKDHRKADLVVVGLQEFRDTCKECLDWRKVMREHLWQDSGNATENGTALSTVGYMDFITRFKPGWLCELGSHYNTMMYVAVRPKSGWTFEQATDVHVGGCVGGDGKDQVGCSIDNGGATECGKAVNLLILQARHASTQTTQRICLMNTHMSYKETPAGRMKFIKEALDDTKEAKCDTVVFVGDFNSRLQCGRVGVSDPYLFKNKTSEILKKVCELGSFANASDADELRAMLSTDGEGPVQSRRLGQPSLSVNSDKKVDKRDCKGGNIGGLGLAGLREPSEAGPAFAPTYKVVPCSKKDAVAADKCQVGSKKLCYVEDGNKKHRPAWTDRVLLWSPTQEVEFKTESYKSAERFEGVKTDHLPVVALFKAARAK